MHRYQHLLLGGVGFIGTELARALRQSTQGTILCVGKNTENFAVEGVRAVAEEIEKDSPQWAAQPAQDVFILVGQNSPTFNKEAELVLLEKIITGLNSWPEKTRVFYFSSSLVYGNTPEPVSEEAVPAPVDRYSQFKYEAEQLLERDLDQKHTLSILRLSNVYGSPKNKGFIGFLMRAVLESAPLTVNGGGQQERDYIYMNDVTQAIVAVASKEQEERVEVVNIATGTSYTLNEVVAAFGEVLGKPIPHTISAAAPEEVRVNRLRNEKLKEKYGYSITTTLKEGLQKTLKKYQE